MVSRPARGMRDFLPADVRRRRFAIGVVEEVYQRYGFVPLETPALENIETLTGKYGEEGAKLIFKVLRRGEHEASGETDLALRYDLTVPLARVIAEHRGRLPKFFKRYQIQPVWRADRPARGRFREFFQCDVDAIGSRSPVVEVDMLSAVSEILTTLGFHDFTIHLNHRELLTQTLDAAGIDRSLHNTALVALDKLDKIGREGVFQEMVARGVNAESTKAVLASVAGEFLSPDPASTAGENVNQIMKLCEATAASGRVTFAPRLARGLSYYTGAIMEVTVPDLPGSLGGGGRYDGLIGMFSGEDIPACGFSLGLERILVVMGERNMFPAGVDRSAADVLVTVFDVDSIPEALRLAAELRVLGYRVDVYPEPDKLGRQLKYASAIGVPRVAILGSEERASGVVTMKNMISGEQMRIPRDELGRQLGPPATSHEPRTTDDGQR